MPELEMFEGVTESLAAGYRIPEIVIYTAINFGGKEYRTNLNITHAGGFNDQISSFIIVSGIWKFYLAAGYNLPAGGELGPGYYSWVEDYGIPNDQVSSIKCVGLTQQ